VTLKQVLKECAGHIDRDCVFDNVCYVLAGEPCKYFERCVLAVHPDVYSEYVATCGEVASESMPYTDVISRRCPDCNQILVHSRRYCDSCRDTRRRQANKEAQARRRKSGSNVSS